MVKIYKITASNGSSRYYTELATGKLKPFKKANIKKGDTIVVKRKRTPTSSVKAAARKVFNRRSAAKKNADLNHTAKSVLRSKAGLKKYRKNPARYDFAGVDTRTARRGGGKKKVVSRKKTGGRRKTPARKATTKRKATKRKTTTKRKAPAKRAKKSTVSKPGYRFGTSTKTQRKKYATARKAEGKLGAGVSGPLMPGQGRVGGSGYRRGYKGDSAGIGPAISVTDAEKAANIAAAEARVV